MTAPAEATGGLGVFYDPLSYPAYDHPYDVYAQLREQAPVYYNHRRDLWVLSRYADVKQCLADHEHFINALGNDMDGTHDSYGPGNLIALDEPHHSVIRQVVQPAFAGREILALEPRIREFARELLGSLRARGGGDLAAEVALPVVFDAGLRFLGAPVGESVFWQEHLLRSMARTVGQFGLPDDAAVSNREAEAYIHDVLAARRADLAAGAEPGLDVISNILVAGEREILDEAEQAGLAHLVLSASTDAPAALVTNCVALLDKFPALQEHLRANPTKVKAFVEETLRYDTPATNLCRQTTAAVRIGGVTIPEDSRVMVLLGSANRDELVYEHPDRFDINRTIGPENRILSFGEGIHACMGAAFARLVAQVVVEELVALLDGVEVRVVGLPERWAKQMVRGFSSLPVRFVPVGEVQRTTKPHASTAHLEQVQHLSTRVTLATRELETDVRVVGKEMVADGVVALTLRALDGKALPRWEPGAHVDLIIRGVATRQYSLSGDPAHPSAWRLGILRDAAGSGGSLYVHDRLAVGDVVRVRGPRNNFPLVDSTCDDPGGRSGRSSVAAGLWRAYAPFDGLPGRAGAVRRQGVRSAAGRDGTARPRGASWGPARRDQGVLLRTRAPAQCGGERLSDLAQALAPRRAIRGQAPHGAGPQDALRGLSRAQRPHPHGAA